MTPTRSLARTVAPLVGLLFATPALARPMATLFVDNDYAGPVHVHVDGQPFGTVRPHDDAIFPVPMGQHHVTVLTPSGFVLTSEVDWFMPHRSEGVQVRAPMAPLTVRNAGNTPMFVDGVQGGIWLDPGRTHTAWVPAGNVRVTASVRQGPGMVPVEQETVWVEPGQGGRAVFEWCPPPTRLIVSNQEPRPVRILVDGRSVGELQPGASLALDVRPGMHDVDAWSPYGGMIFDRDVRVAPGTDTSVAVFRPRPGPPPTYAGPGPRPGHGPGHGPGWDRDDRDDRDGWRDDDRHDDRDDDDRHEGGHRPRT